MSDRSAPMRARVRERTEFERAGDVRSLGSNDGHASGNAPGVGYGNAVRTVMATLGWRHVSEHYNMLPPVADFPPSDLNVDERAYLAAAFTIGTATAQVGLARSFP